MQHALASTVEDLEAIPEPLRPYYEERDGKQVLRANVREHPDTLALRRALDEERGNVKSWKQKAAEFEAVGYTPQQIESLRAELASRRGGDASAAAIRSAVDEEFLPRLRARQARVEELEREIANRDVAADVRRAMLEAGVLPDEIEDQLRLTRDRFDRKDGRTIVLDEDGRPDTMTVEKFWKDYYRQKKPRVYRDFEPGRAGTPPLAPLVLTREQAKNHASYRAARDRAARDGRELVIEG